MSEVSVGMIVDREPMCFFMYDEQSRKFAKFRKSGVVVYVHPKGRFHVVAFEAVGGTIRESFYGVEV